VIGDAVILSWGTALRAVDEGRNPGRVSRVSVGQCAGRGGAQRAVAAKNCVHPDRKAPAPGGATDGSRWQAARRHHRWRSATRGHRSKGRQNHSAPAGRKKGMAERGPRGTLAEEDSDPRTDVNRRLIPRHVLPPLPGRDARMLRFRWLRIAPGHVPWRRAACHRLPAPAPPAHPPRSSAAHETRINTRGFLEAAETAGRGRGGSGERRRRIVTLVMEPVSRGGRGDVRRDRGECFYLSSPRCLLRALRALRVKQVFLSPRETISCDKTHDPSQQILRRPPPLPPDRPPPRFRRLRMTVATDRFRASARGRSRCRWRLLRSWRVAGSQ
jgi:hypothetical protein